MHETLSRPMHPDVTVSESPALHAIGNMGPYTYEAPVMDRPISEASVALSSLGFESPFEKLGLPGIRRDQDGRLSLTEDPLTLADLPSEHARMMKQKKDLDQHEVRMMAVKQGAWLPAVAAAEQQRLAENFVDAVEDDDDDIEDEKPVSLAEKRANKAIREAQNPAKATKPSLKVAA